MSSYLEQEYDFISRTKLILKQYDENIKEPNKYNVTLLLNCFVGLIILPQQLWFKDLPRDLISEKEWGISPTHISYIKDEQKKDIQNIVRHLRNSLSHYKFFVFSNKMENISSIKFVDYDGNNKSFEAIIPISNMIKFLNIFSEHMLNKMKKSKL